MGMKYFLCDDIWNVSDRCEILLENEDTSERNSYKNPYHIPVIFTGDTNIIENNPDGNLHINNMFTTLTGISVLDKTGETDYDKLQTASEKIRENAADVISENGAVIKLTATGEYLLSTIMYEDSWNIWVNGKKVQPQLCMEHFLSVPLTEGECEVTMLYIPRGLVPGICFMALGIAVLLAMPFINKKIKKENDI